MSLFTERLKLLRKKHNVTQVEVAKSINITERTYQRLEANGIPSHESLIALADYFDVSLDYLVGRTDKPNSHK